MSRDDRRGDTLAYRELDLRFKTNSSDKGPEKRKPAILPAGMMGDRASVIFTDPSETSSFVEKACRAGRLVSRRYPFHS